MKADVYQNSEGEGALRNIQYYVDVVIRHVVYMFKNLLPAKEDRYSYSHPSLYNDIWHIPFNCMIYLNQQVKVNGGFEKCR